MSGEKIIRHLSPELYAWLYKQVHDATYNVVAANPRAALLIMAASRCQGIHESEERNKGQFVELFQKTIGDAHGEPWCMSFVQSMVAYVEKSSASLSALAAGEHCLTVFRKSESIQVNPPLPGDLIIWRHGDTENGHVGIITAVQPRFFVTLEGNTAPKDEIEREGDGVYLRNRPNKDWGGMKIMGFLRPFPT